MLSKKAKENKVLMEARKVLLNQVELDSDGHFITTTEARIQLWGAADGESKLRLWGMSTRAYDYTSTQSNTQAIYKVGKAMGTIGRGINLRSKDVAATCIVKTHIFYPVVLVMLENEEGNLELSAYTPRWLTAGAAIRMAVRKLDKAADGVVERISGDLSLLDRVRVVIDAIKASKENKENKKEKKKDAPKPQDFWEDEDWVKENEITDDDIEE